MEKIQIRKSCADDVPDIMKVIEEAILSLKNRGVDQWQDGYPNAEVIAEDIRKGISYVACLTEKEQERVVGTAVISFEPENCYTGIYDGSWRSEKPYAVVHRIATAEQYKRLGIAGRLIDYAESLCKERDIAWLRIDTHRDNLVMQSFLEKQGFEKRGSITLDSGAHRFGYDAKVITNQPAECRKI